MPNSERTPLLRNHASNFWAFGAEREDDMHTQFCKLVGIPPSDLPPDADEPPINPKSLYGRAIRLRRDQWFTYQFTAGLSNTMLLSQVILGAALTALGASNSSHILITVFGAMNTVIAGLVAYLKSRGQPMRSRMYRDDLERVVDEIENSEIMWLGISKGMHGYSDINTVDAVTVRSEVARLTRLYDRAVRSNTMNNPDMYLASGGEGVSLGLKPGSHPGQTAIALPPALPVSADPATTTSGAAATPTPAPPAADPDESPATAPKPPSKADPPKETPKDDKAPEAAKPENTSPPAEAPKEAPKDSIANGDKLVDVDAEPVAEAGASKS